MKASLLVLLRICSFKVSSHFGFRRIPLAAVLKRVNGGQRWRWGDQLRGYNKKTGKRIVMLWTGMVIVEVMREEECECTLKIQPIFWWIICEKWEEERSQRDSSWAAGHCCYLRQEAISGESRWGQRPGALCLTHKIWDAYLTSQVEWYLDYESELSVIQPLVMLGSVSSPDISLLNLYPLPSLSLLLLELTD